VETGVYHVTSRGNARQAIFRDEVDYSTFLRMLAPVAADFGWLCSAFCLMPNHYHLLLEVPEGSLPRGMHLLNGRYARRFNVRHERDGHLFQGPYRVEPVTRDSHFAEACRYIVLNPVRAGLVAEPGEWPWSSYRIHAGFDEPPAFMERLPATFDSHESYRAFVEGGSRVDRAATWL
jgi:putative transposase